MQTILPLCLRQPRRCHLEHGAFAANIQGLAFVRQQTIYRDNEHADIRWPRTAGARLGTISVACNDIDFTARRNGNNMIALLKDSALVSVIGVSELTLSAQLAIGGAIAVAEQTRLELAVVGDVVNVASRLQGANKEVGTEMLVSAAVLSGCSAHINFGRSFQLDLRGKVGRVHAHEVLGVKAST